MLTVGYKGYVKYIKISHSIFINTRNENQKKILYKNDLKYKENSKQASK